MVADPALVGSVVRPVSGTPVVALAIALIAVAVISVLLISYVFYWRSGRR